MKKLFKNILLFFIICSLFSCKNNIKEKYDYKIGLIPDVSGVSDQSFNQTTWEGLLKFAEDHKNVKVAYIESKVDADYLVNAQIFIDSGYDLIIGCGYQFRDCFYEISRENPNKKFLIIDENIEGMDNLACALFSTEESSYLAGIAAACQSKTGKIGIVLANNSKLLETFGVGYIEGAKSVNEDIVVYQSNINTFSDATLAKVAANTMITNGADVIYSAAGAAGSGAISACGENDKYAIGVDTDQSFIDPDHILTSAIKRTDLAVYNICEELVNEKFTPGARMFNLENNGVGIVKSGKLLSKETVEKVEKVEKDIIDKKIIVHSEAKYCPEYELE